MIEPKFATMLCFVQTDALIDDPDAALRAAVAGSFERITVDGQMSTNDTVLLQATGEAGSRRRQACSTPCCSARPRDGGRRRGRDQVGRIEVPRRPRATRPSASRRS